MTDRGLFTTSEVATILGRTPGAVRLMVTLGVLKPRDRVKSYRGRPTMRFDAGTISRAVRDAPWIDLKSGSLPPPDCRATFWPRDASPDSVR